MIGIGFVFGQTSYPHGARAQVAFSASASLDRWKALHTTAIGVAGDAGSRSTL